MNRLAVFVDGTWNVAESNTHVRRLFEYAVNGETSKGTRQNCLYHVGVGTDWSNHLRGAFGKGVNSSVRNCYQWLVDNYCEGDEIFLIGFSRGAFIARSLAGFIDQFGLISPSSHVSTSQAFELYRSAGLGKSDEKRHEATLRDSRRVDIAFVGVWDTVRYYELPFGSVRGLSRSQNLFHFIQPGTSVRRLCQALAVDEHRAPYKAELWQLPRHQVENGVTSLEQRWFAGAHSNVGGGYSDDALAHLPLRWMQLAAEDAGLLFRERSPIDVSDHLQPVVDSYAEFLGGAYKYIPGHARHIRPIGNLPASDQVTNQVIDGSVIARWRELQEYRPANIAAWAAARQLDVGSLTGDQIV